MEQAHQALYHEAEHPSALVLPAMFVSGKMRRKALESTFRISQAGS